MHLNAGRVLPQACAGGSQHNPVIPSHTSRVCQLVTKPALSGATSLQCTGGARWWLKNLSTQFIILWVPLLFLICGRWISLWSLKLGDKNFNKCCPLRKYNADNEVRGVGKRSEFIAKSRTLPMLQPWGYNDTGNQISSPSTSPGPHNYLLEKEKL